MAYTDYTTPTEAMSQWVKNISPTYFNFDTAKLHRTGVFGYINEVMATTNMDTYHAVTVARREFYPNTANYTKSLFKMAALQRISYPMANPAHASCTLLLREAELVKYGERVTNTTDVYQIMIDENMVMMADDIPFMLDYPIKILFKKTPIIDPAANDTMGDYSNRAGVVKVASNTVYYTISHDTTFRNDLNTQTEKYLKHRTLTYAGETLLLINIGVHQCSKTISEQMINISPTVGVSTLDFAFEGNLCNFEVFYTPNGSDKVIQLLKLPLNSIAATKPFCMYSLTSDNIIRIHFPENNYFTPKFNSKITLHIYTTLGQSGNFRLFNGELLCSPVSDTYVYNQSLTIQGQIRGASEGGYDMPSFEDFRQRVVRAYATNMVIATEQDLQMYFNERMATQNNKILFFKRRDDVFERLYGAFMLLRDVNGDVIPTNSLVADLRVEEDFNDDEKRAYIYGDSSLPTTVVIKPGSIWRYSIRNHKYYTHEDDHDWKYEHSKNEKYRYNMNTHNDGLHIERAYVTTTITAENCIEIAQSVRADGTPIKYQFEDGTVRQLGLDPEQDNFVGNFLGERVFNSEVRTRMNLNCDIDDSTEEMFFTNPFLISISRIRNSVAYYINSFDTTAYMNMTKVNDSSYIQFINTAFTVTRNALVGENFYKFTIKLMPTVESEDLRQSLVITRDELAAIEDAATNNGIESDFVDSNFPIEIRADYAGTVLGYKWLSNSYYTCECGDTTGKENHNKLCPACHKYVLKYSTNAIYQVVRYEPNPEWHVTYDDITHYNVQEGLDDTDEFGNFLGYIKVSPSMSEVNLGNTNTTDYTSTPWYSTIYHPGDRFGQNDILATRKCKDLLVLRAIGEFADVPGMYMPFFIEDYNAESDTYTMAAYLSTNDEISDDGKLTITGGFYYDDILEKTTPFTDNITINPYNMELAVSTYLRYDDIYGNDLNSYVYLKNHVYTNVYENDASYPINLLRKMDFIRSTLIQHNIRGAEASIIDPWWITVKEIPVVRASWIKKSTNISQLLYYLNSNHSFIEEVYDILENNYTIDMKFFNTYGKSRFYDIGIGDPTLSEEDQIMPLDTVNVSLRFGVRISTLSDSTMFNERLIKFIRQYVESLNELSHDGDSINLMDMVTDINNNFNEIERLEFYGIGDLDAARAQIIKSWSSKEIEELGYKEYVPEFINVYLKYNSATYTYEPDIEITYLD